MTNKKEKLIEQMKKYRKKGGFIKFVREQLNAEPTEQQLKVMKDMEEKRRITVKAGHGVGKTTLAAWFLIWFLVVHPFSRIPATSNKEDQVKERLWPEVKTWLRGSPWNEFVVVNKTRIHIAGYPEDWFAKIEAASDPENLAGYHAKYLLYIVDEASGLGDEFAAVINGAITEENAKLFMIGNPTKRSGYFYDSHTKNTGQWASHTMSARNSPLVSEEWVQEMKSEWGQDSDIVRVRVDGKFPKSESDSYISTTLIENAFDYVIDGPAGKKVLGVDVARYGDDESVLIGRHGKKMIQFDTYKKFATTELTGAVINAIQNHNYDEVNIDIGAMGPGVVDQVREKLKNIATNCKVNEINFGGKGDDHNHNMTAKLWRNIRDKLKENIDLRKDEKLKEQLTNRKYSFDSSGRLKMESKEHMKARGIESPDRADALVLAYWDGKDRKPLTWGR